MWGIWWKSLKFRNQVWNHSSRVKENDKKKLEENKEGKGKQGSKQRYQEVGKLKLILQS